MMNPEIQVGIAATIQKTQNEALKFEEAKDFANAALSNLKIAYFASLQQLDPTVFDFLFVFWESVSFFFFLDFLLICYFLFTDKPNTIEISSNGT
jgi:hypothetical protein